MSSNLSRIILETRGGGVPFLNDYLISLFEFNFFNIKFPDLLHYIDIFEEYKKKNIDKPIIEEFFHITDYYISFHDFLNIKNDNGSSDDNIYYIQTNTGKSKILIHDYIKFLNLLKPKYAVVPYEYLSKDCGNKKIKRYINKLDHFFNTLGQSEIKFIIPIFLYHEFNSKILSYTNGNYMIFYENYKELNYNKIEEYKKILSTLDGIKLKFGDGHPIDLMLSYEIGCNYFEVSYPFNISEKGKSIISLFDISLESEQIDLDYFKYDIKTIDLNDLIHENDHSVILDECKCFTCEKGYTRAYIHHLLKCSELNACTLILMHNLNFYQNFFKVFTSYKEIDRKNYINSFLQNQCVKI